MGEVKRGLVGLRKRVWLEEASGRGCNEEVGIVATLKEQVGVDARSKWVCLQEARMLEKKSVHHIS